MEEEEDGVENVPLLKEVTDCCDPLPWKGADRDGRHRMSFLTNRVERRARVSQRFLFTCISLQPWDTESMSRLLFWLPRWGGGVFIRNMPDPNEWKPNKLVDFHGVCGTTVTSKVSHYTGSVPHYTARRKQENDHFQPSIVTIVTNCFQI